MKKMLTMLLCVMVLAGSAAMAEEAVDASSEAMMEKVLAALEAIPEELTEAPDAAAAETVEAPAKVKAEPADSKTREAKEASAEGERSVCIKLENDGKDVVYDGDRIALKAELKGYEDVTYTIQWQTWNSEDEEWENIPGEVEDTLWLDVTESMSGMEYRVLVTIL